ncbi:MAG: hypothetical protein ABI839_01110 [Verrucomicrobiota bacterium]
MGQRSSFCGALAILTAVVMQSSFASSDGRAASPADEEHLARLECIMPDGRNARVSFRREPDASVLMADDDSVTCPLVEGDTTFVVALPQTTMLERLSFINENATARGELQIAVSNDHLPAASDHWVPVDGAIAFTRKRLFNLSLVGVEAKYVRLIFHVQREGRIAGFGLYGEPTVGNLESPLLQAVNRASSTGSTSLLRFNFANLYLDPRSVCFDIDRCVSARPADGDTQSAFSLAPTEPRPTVIVGSP